MKRIAIAGTILGALLITGCTSEPAAPTPREQACETFKNVTPGFFEMTAATNTLADPSASSSERIAAMNVSLDVMAGRGRTAPYTCTETAFMRYLEDQNIN